MLVDFNNFSCQYLLESLPLILVRCETKRGYHHITFVEPARRQITQHGAHILVLKLAAQLPQHNVALLDLTALGLSRLYAKGLALAYHFQDVRFHIPYFYFTSRP